MLNKIFLCLIFYFLFILPSDAKTVLIKAIDNVYTASPSVDFSFKVVNNSKTNKHQILEPGSVVSGHIINVVQPKRLKRDAYLVFIPDSFTLPSSDNIEVKVKKNHKTRIKIYEEFKVPDKKEMVENAGTYIAGKLVPGLDYAIKFSQGAIKPDEDENMFHAGARYIYEHSPLSYFNKGDKIYIYSGSLYKFVFDDDIFDIDNYGLLNKQ